MKAFIYAAILFAAVILAMADSESEFWFFGTKLIAASLLALAWFLLRGGTIDEETVGR